MRGIRSGSVSIAVGAAAITMACASAARAQVTYRVSFEGTWTAQSHPDAFPNFAHFSPPIGAAHAEEVSLWAVGALATDGIEAMAEIGATGTLAAEISAHTLAGDAGPAAIGSGIGATGVTEIEIDVSATWPEVSVVSMIAPSPDWFVGVSGLDLRDGSGGWEREVVVNLLAYDAGTDSGPAFTSSNADTQPPEPIAGPNTFDPFIGAAPVARFTFTRLGEQCTGDFDDNAAVNSIDYFGFVNAFFGLSLDADTNGDGVLNSEDYFEFINAFFGDCAPG